VLILIGAFSALAAEEKAAPPKDPGAPAEAIAKWREMKLGLFITWGPCSIKGVNIGWERGGVVPIEEYDNLYKQFNPVKFNADEWMKLAKEAGMKYTVFVAKHGDGFSMFDTKQNDYSIMHTPFGRDITKELAEASRKQGIAFGIYYDIGDWYHPDFPHGSPGGQTIKPNANIDRYEKYMCKQIEELLKNYGPVVTLWYDYPQDFDVVRGSRVIHFTRNLQPDILINDRCARPDYALPGDYYTAEQQIGAMTTTRPWETCLTITSWQWSWSPTDPVRSLKECLQTLVKVVGGDGNLLLNIGPKPDGSIEPEQVKRLKEIGQWMAKYGESIYGTRGGPFPRGPWGAATYKGDTVYVHILDANLDTVTLPRLAGKIIGSSVLTGGTATVNQTEKSIEIAVPKADRQEIDTIVVLKLDGPVAPVKQEEPVKQERHEAAPSQPSPRSPCSVRELYALGHFHNSYEEMGQYEMRRFLAEAKHWGFTRYGDWFDVEDCREPFAEMDHDALMPVGRALWNRKKENFIAAQNLGLECELVIYPNHVYTDQCRPELKATKGELVFGQTICPSNPEARKIILKNNENLFADLAASGVRLKSIASLAYDFGGCNCEKCQPWILTYAKLTREIHAVAERYHPGVENHMVSWWWTPEEHRLLADWADREAPGWIKSIYLAIPYNSSDLPQVPLPKGCQRRAMAHLSYAETTSRIEQDCYGVFGPMAAPARLQKTAENLAALGETGVFAYSEGVSDDVNLALIAGLSSGQYRTSDEVLRAYARRYFGADEPQAAAWAKWLAVWEWSFQLDPKQMAEDFAKLHKPAAGNWRVRQWELKLELMRLNRAINSETQWTPSRLEAVDQFWQVKERMVREVWGVSSVGVHMMNRRNTTAAWYNDWAKHIGAQQKQTGKNW
jgi:alpha-L-fucosidase